MRSNEKKAMGADIPSPFDNNDEQPGRESFSTKAGSDPPPPPQPPLPPP